MQQEQHDALAVAQNGGQPSDDTDTNDVDDGLDDDMMDKISSSPSIEDEDIDFEFVYALHTFVATVEGQANATKGDTMVLLDDSNSYWWLVRVVKDSSIGYLPAEHIETPTERLARLNKHRNIDLSATMLGDQAEKPKNPIKSAMRRRKTKTVAFADPTIHAYSDYDYSSEDDDLETEFFAQQQQQQQYAEQGEKDGHAVDDSERSRDQSAVVEPLNMSQAGAPRQDSTMGESMTTSGSITENGNDTSDDMVVEPTSEPSRSRNGTVRNTDSFFKDDTLETKKITLTPNLLRDDNEPRGSTESRDLKPRVSLDKLEPDRKEDKKRRDKDRGQRDKKPGVIRSLFSRGKEKKRTADDDVESVGKVSLETSRGSHEKMSGESAESDEIPATKLDTSLQRHPSKLQKQTPPVDASIAVKLTSRSEHPVQQQSGRAPPQVGDVRGVGPDITHANQIWSQDTSSDTNAVLNSPTIEANAQESKPSSSEPQNQNIPNASQLQVEPQQSSLAGSSVDNSSKAPNPVPSDVHGTVDTSSHSRDLEHTDGDLGRQSTPQTEIPGLVSDSPNSGGRSSPYRSPSPELTTLDDEEVKQGHSSVNTSCSVGATSSWNDTGLRLFFDSGAYARDLISIVYDRSDVAPAGADHPVVGILFRDQNAKLAEITNQLDNMLGDWLARKQRVQSVS